MSDVTIVKAVIVTNEYGYTKTYKTSAGAAKEIAVQIMNRLTARYMNAWEVNRRKEVANDCMANTELNKALHNKWLERRNAVYEKALRRVKPILKEVLGK